MIDAACTMRTGFMVLLISFLLSPAVSAASNYTYTYPKGAAGGNAANGAADAAAGAAFAGIFGAFWLFMVSFWVIWVVLMIVGVLGIILWVFMLIDCVKRTFPTENEKIAWILVLALTSWIGAVIYYFLVKRKDKK